MTDTELGTMLILVWLASIPGCAIWAKLLRGRDPRSLVVTTTYQGGPATAVRGRDNFVPATVFCGYFATLFALLALGSWSDSKVGAIVFLVPATYIGIGSWLIGSGRVGDGTVWFTRDGLTQRANGLEQSMRWDDMVHMRLEWDGVELDSSASIKARRYAPRAWIGRARSVDPIMKLIMGNLPRGLQLLAAIERWATDDFARLEIGTPEAFERLLGTRV